MPVKTLNLKEMLELIAPQLRRKPLPTHKKPAGKAGGLLRRGGSNSRPSGYEPDELPLLYFAIWAANIGRAVMDAKQILNF